MIPTLHLWSLLRHEPVSAEFRKLLHLDRPTKRPAWMYLLVVVLLACAPGGIVIWLLAIINFLCLRRARTIANVLANQSQSGQYDLLAVTPIGAMGLVLGVARAYFHSMLYSLRGMAKVWGMVTGGAILVLIVFGVDFAEMLQVAFMLAISVAALFVDYMQSVVCAVVIGTFAGITSDNTKAQVSAFAGYFGLQIIFYAALIAVTVTSFFMLWSSVSFGGVFFLFVMPLLILFALREGVIAIVWKLIRERINDDVPAWKVYNNMKEKLKRTFNRLWIMPLVISLGWAIWVPLWFVFLLVSIGPIYGPSLTIPTIQKVAGHGALIGCVFGATVGVAIRFARPNFGFLRILLLCVGWALTAAMLISLALLFVMSGNLSRNDYGAANALYVLVIFPLCTALGGGITAWLTGKLLSGVEQSITAGDIKYLMRHWIVAFFAFMITLILTFVANLLYSMLSAVRGPMGAVEFLFMAGTPGLVSGILCSRALMRVLEGVKVKTNEV